MVGLLLGHEHELERLVDLIALVDLVVGRDEEFPRQVVCRSNGRLLDASCLLGGTGLFLGNAALLFFVRLLLAPLAFLLLALLTLHRILRGRRG